MRRDIPAGLFDIRKVRLAIFRQRRRHANGDHIAFGQPEKIAGGNETVILPHTCQHLIGNRLDIAAARFDRGNFTGVDVETDDLETGLSDRHGKRQADIAEADHPRFGAFVFDAGKQGPGNVWGSQSVSRSAHVQKMPFSWARMTDLSRLGPFKFRLTPKPLATHNHPHEDRLLFAAQVTLPSRSLRRPADGPTFDESDDDGWP
ncbi:hypothetical protein AGR8A_Cc70567 [Agrobacterium fabrum str. J-07]|nr:hypothetical protein AGR8A_Cc70567 [Agrobacterium fabrum str. J-07]